MADKWVVKCAVAQLRNPDGSYQHLYAGAEVPELYDGDRETLHDQGLIGPDDQEFVPLDKTDGDKDRKSRQGLGKWVSKTDANKTDDKSSAVKVPAPAAK